MPKIIPMFRSSPFPLLLNQPKMALVGMGIEKRMYFALPWSVETRNHFVARSTRSRIIVSVGVIIVDKRTLKHKRKRYPAGMSFSSTSRTPAHSTCLISRVNFLWHNCSHTRHHVAPNFSEKCRKKTKATFLPFCLAFSASPPAISEIRPIRKQ